jgi:hypothetical protein
MENKIKTKQSEIASKMKALGRKLESGDDSEPLAAFLARSPANRSLLPRVGEPASD